MSHKDMLEASSHDEKRAFKVIDSIPHSVLKCARHLLQLPTSTQANTSSSSSGQLLELLAIAVSVVNHMKSCMTCKNFKRETRKEARRLTFFEVTEWYTDEEFKNAYRMSRRTFHRLANLLMPRLMRNAEKARHSSSGLITPYVRLAVTLRMLAGGQHQDLMLLFRIPKSTCNKIFHETVRAINQVLKFPGIPTDVVSLSEMSRKFKFSRRVPNPLNGCVGAVDGIVIQIKMPGEEYGPRQYFNRKGYYAVAVQACVDSDYRVRCFSALATGSTHDSQALEVSNLGAFLQTERLPPEFWLAGDEAYACTEFLIIPYGRSFAPHGSYKDSFNFYHSSMRIHVEQTFGIITARWRILQSPLAFELARNLATIEAIFLLHNWCVENNDKTEEHLAYEEGDEETVQLPLSEWSLLSRQAINLGRLERALRHLYSLERQRKRSKGRLTDAEELQRQSWEKEFKRLLRRSFDDNRGRERSYKRELLTQSLMDSKIVRPGVRKRSRSRHQ